MNKNGALSLLAERLEQAEIDKAMTDPEFFELQRLVLGEAVQYIKGKDTDELAQANYIIGLVGLTDGDRFRIPPQNVLNHLKAAYELGHETAGILLYRAYKGMYPIIPEMMRNLARGILILEGLARKKSAHGAYELAQHYLDLIDGYAQAGDEAPEAHYHQAYAYAKDSMEMGFCGGYLLIGTMTFHGFLGLVAQHKGAAYRIFAKGLEKVGPGFLEYNLAGQLHHWVGYCQFAGDGVSMNRIDGIVHYKLAAEMNCGEAVQWLEDNKQFVEHVQSEEGSGTTLIYDLDIDPEPEPAMTSEQAEAIQQEHDPAKIINPFEQFNEMDVDPARPFGKKTTTH